MLYAFLFATLWVNKVQVKATNCLIIWLIMNPGTLHLVPQTGLTNKLWWGGTTAANGSNTQQESKHSNNPAMITPIFLMGVLLQQLPKYTGLDWDLNDCIKKRGADHLGSCQLPFGHYCLKGGSKKINVVLSNKRPGFKETTPDETVETKYVSCLQMTDPPTLIQVFRLPGLSIKACRLFPNFSTMPAVQMAKYKLEWSSARNL